MQSLAYLLDGRTIRRLTMHIVPAITLGVFLAAHYDSIVMQAPMFFVPVGGMIVALRRGHDEVLATVTALSDFRDQRAPASAPERATAGA